MKDSYVQALQEMLAAGTKPEECLAALQKVMQSRGHERLYGAVLKTVLRELEATRAKRTVVRVPNETVLKSAQAEIAASLATLGSTEEPHVSLDPTLVGGYQVEANYQRVDASYKQLLASLYRNITTH